MQRLHLNPDEKLTIKEYLKRKKKQAKSLRKRSKITYIMLSVIVLLCIYVFTQFYVYNRNNNYKYTAGEGVNAQGVYNIYYVVAGYAYDPVYSISSINSNGFNDKTVYQNSGLIDIQANKDYIFGIKQGSLCRISKKSNELEVLVEKDVSKYKLDNNRLYYICESDLKLRYINLENKEMKDLAMNSVSEVLVDANNIFVVKDQKTQKSVFKYDKEGQNELALTKNSNVSYVIQDDKSIYYVNKNDNNRIYKVGKDGSNEDKLADISSVSDKGEIKEIDGSKNMFVNNGELYYINVEDSDTLWKINLSNKEKNKVMYVQVEILQNVDNTCYYKVKNEMGVYLYNLDTNFMSQISKRKVKEFFVDKTEEVKNTNQNNKMVRT